MFRYAHGTIICMFAKFLQKNLHLEVKRCMKEIEKLNKEYVDVKKCGKRDLTVFF